MFVIDASAVLEVLLKTPLGARIAPRILISDATLHAPHLLDIELLHVLRRLTQSGLLATADAQRAIDDILDLQLIRYPHDVLLYRIWELRSSVTAYDASYIALAEFLDMPLFTCDARLSRSHGHRAKIVLLT
jgi:predicted nucleic acid-binding protein